MCVYYQYMSYPQNNRLLYSAMYNMERYCTSLYCIENPQASSPIRVFNTIRTSTISFHIVHNTVYYRLSSNKVIFVWSIWPEVHIFTPRKITGYWITTRSFPYRDPYKNSFSVNIILTDTYITYWPREKSIIDK